MESGRIYCTLIGNGPAAMDERYAHSTFCEDVSCDINYDQLFFNNIKEKNLMTAVDVLINGMHNNLLVMVKNRFHCNEIIGRHINDSLPSNITIPLLIVPYQIKQVANVGN